MAFGESWLISVMMRFTSNGSRVMNELATGAQAAEAKVDRVTAAMTRLRNASTMVAGGIALIGAAIDVYGISQAAKLQLAMTGVFTATGANAKQQAALTKMVLDVSGRTAQSATTIANEAFMVASSGINKPDRLMKAFPQIAYASDVLWLSTKGTPKAVDPVNASMQMTTLSHLFGAYSGKPLHDMVDFAVRLMMVQPDALAKVITQAKYFVPTAIGAGVDLHNIPSSDLAVALASMGQTGLLQGRGGTGLARYIEYMMKAPMITASLSKNRRNSMVDLGLFDASGRNRFLDSRGNFELGASMHYLGEKFDTWAKTGQRGRFIQDVFGAFLEQGGRYVETMTLPAVRAQQSQNVTAMQRIAPRGQAVNTLWERYMHTTVGAWAYFVTNFQNIWIYTFMPTLPVVTKALRGFGDAFARVGGFLRDNPGFASGAAYLITWVTGLSALRFGLGMLMKFGGLATFFESMKGLSGIAIAARVLDEGLLAGVGTKLYTLGLRLAGISGPATAAASGVNALGTSVATLSGARAAALGLTALGGAITVVTSAVAFWAGIAMEMSAASKDPRRARLDAWSTWGANRGIPMPGGGGAGDVDVFGRPIVHIEINDKTAGGIQTLVKSHGAIFTSPKSPGVLNLTSPSLGLHP